MLEALGSPGERSILSEKKRRTGTGDGEEGKPASFREEESQAERKVEESGEAEERSGREEDGEKRADSEEESKEEKKGQLTPVRVSCQIPSASVFSVIDSRRNHL